MKQVDCIIVGLGIAGIATSEEWLKHGKSILVFDAAEGTSTEVSGGVINPVVLKRFTPVWLASEFMRKATATYNSISAKVGSPVIAPTSIHRIFNNIEEQNDWTVASDKNELSDFLASEIQPAPNTSIHAPYGIGEVKGALRLYPSHLLRVYRDWLERKGLLRRERFDYDALSLHEKGIRYRDVEAKRIVFSEGFAALKNPYFPDGLLVPNKGEYVIVEAPQLQLEFVLKGAMFVIPMGNDRYKVGATFSRDETSLTPTADAAERMEMALAKMVKTPFKIVDQIAGVRPTTKDRRPLLGSATLSDRIHFLNGLGTRGLLMAPLLAEWLFHFSEFGNPLPPEVDIKRFRQPSQDRI
ncbi:MAG: FAD-dependent oxidoreductase [Flavobacteriaceae bacterium]|nr:FAD-dependent oxidoreductase [Flavobacteriaceae bacterium]